MSQEIREKALGAAVTIVGGASDADAVVEAAKKFATFLLGGVPASAPAKAPAQPAATKTATAPAKVAKTAAKPAETKPAAPKKDEVDPDAKKMVGDKVNEMLKANKRDEAVALLASFADATSATGIVKQGDEVIQAFMEGADAILSADSGSLAD